MIENYSRVRLLTNRFQSEGVCYGALGYIIEVYDHAYEVEFSDESGITQGQIVAEEKELEVCEPELVTKAV